MDELFATDKSFFHYPIRCVFQPIEKQENQAPIQVLFSVPRKKFKLAVTRNLIRRRMREAYRLNKEIIVQPLNGSPISYRIAFLYISSDICNSIKIQEAIVMALKEISQKTEVSS